MGRVCPLWLSLLELKCHELVLLKLWMIFKIYTFGVFLIVYLSLGGAKFCTTAGDILCNVFYIVSNSACFLGRIFEEIPWAFVNGSCVSSKLQTWQANLRRGLYSVVRSKAFKRASALVSKRMRGEEIGEIWFWTFWLDGAFKDLFFRPLELGNFINSFH